ncbi:MAG TPA: TatD family hydrolase [Tissierellaceae bacterium]
MNYIDFHVHIDCFHNYSQIFSNYEKQRVYALFVTNLPEIYQKSMNEFRQSKYVKLALGYNPQLTKKYKFNKELFLKYIYTTKYIGEVGLDFSSEYKDCINEQIDNFAFICNCVSKHPKIMSIHSRKAERDVLKILDEHNIEFAVFHWYSGSINTIDEIKERGYYFSVNYNMLKNKKGRELLKRIPLDRILFETDGPFGCTKGKVMTIGKLSAAYKELENFYCVDDMKKIVYSNLKTLLRCYEAKTKR